MLRGVALFLLCWACPVAGMAQPRGPASYALVIGSNHGGPGQVPLEWAERDAERVATALVELGRFQPEQVLRLRRPRRDDVVSALEQLEARMRSDLAEGREALVVFYYSGHARAGALNLGAELFALDELRERILRLGANLKIVILDACQSGAFSRAKGAAPAADFSYNSTEALGTAGVVVMASSSETELSQESEELQASYFTHHMLVAMRGGGDTNHDGRVTLSETYQYAYQRTLAATAATAIGGQHVSLETDLLGHGDVALSYPARADARLVLARELGAEVVISHNPSRTVVAEVHKVPGDVLVLALPAGRYVAVVREGSRARRCDAILTVANAAVLAVEACEVIEQPVASAKGGAPTVARESWFAELGVGLGAHVNDTYVDSLEEFGYREDGNHLGRAAIVGGYAVAPSLVLGLEGTNLDGRRFARETQETVQGFEWYAYGVGAIARLQRPARRVIPYVQVGLGLTVAKSVLDEIVVTDEGFVPASGSDELAPVRTVERAQWHVGAYASVAAGLQIMVSRHVGCFAQLAWSFAPTIENRMNDSHDVGGIAFTTGVRLRGLGDQ